MELLQGRWIERVRRVGKHIVFDLQDRPRVEPGTVANLQWIVHLGMTGSLLVCAPDVPLPPHTHAVLALSSGKELRFVDPRRFGRLAMHRSSDGAGGFRGPGQEPLSIAVQDFIGLFRGRRLAIKSALLNQSLLHGVGNIYADESLFRAGIRPKRMAGRLRRAELERLHESVQSVLREAIALGGSSVSDYVDADGARVFFSWSTRCICGPGSLAWSAAPRSGGLCWGGGARITARIASGDPGAHADFFAFQDYGFTKTGVAQVPESEDI